MKTKKAGTILLNLNDKTVALVKRDGFYSFPKGHLEENENLIECAIRETEEETNRACHIFNEEDVILLEYTTPKGEEVECYYYIAIDDGETSKQIKEIDKEISEWIYYKDVLNYLSYEDLSFTYQKKYDTICNIFEREKVVDSKMTLKEDYYTFDNLKTANAFFIKPYDFNLNIVGEEKLNREYQIVKEKLGIDFIATVTQQHTSIIKKVTKDNIDDIDIADGLITNEIGVALATKVADCQAIFLYDPIKKAIGNVHSGWKGTVQKIVGNAIALMIKEYGSNIKNIEVYINPSINKCHFEVDQDVYEQFKDSFKEIDINEFIEYKKEKNKYYIDTVGINKRYLEYLGLNKNNIYSSDICTVCNGDTIHSYRYDKEKSGRNLAIISMK